MNLFVLLKMVPDTVEELNVAADGKSLDTEFLRFKLSEPDDHALEQALILKERARGQGDRRRLGRAGGGRRPVHGPGQRRRPRRENPDQPGRPGQRRFGARCWPTFFAAGGQITPDTLLLPGSQAIDDLDGEVAPLLAAALNLPYIGVVCGVQAAEGKATVVKEFAGGLRAEFEVTLPAVLGIQSAEKPPRYVPVAKVRAAMKSAKIEEVDLPAPDRPIRLDLDRMYKPEAAGHAEMFEGAPEEVADKLVEVLAKDRCDLRRLNLWQTQFSFWRSNSEASSPTSRSKCWAPVARWPARLGVPLYAALLGSEAAPLARQAGRGGQGLRRG